MRAFFVTSPHTASASIAGGVQLCSQEYREVLAAAGFECVDQPVELRYRVSTRVLRRLFRHQYFRGELNDQAYRIAHEAEAAGARCIFINMVDLAPMARAMRERLRTPCDIVLLSHGLASADSLHEMRIAQREGRPKAAVGRDAFRLGMQLLQEAEHRRYIDHVFCLSETERELESWLGAKRVTWLPRIARPHPLDWRPVPGRVGFVGTLDHSPNAEGLQSYLRALGEQSTADIEVRIVGGPSRAGEELGRAYPFATYLGPLPDRDLEREASTWTCMVHPLFGFARGCSTKLAVGLGWGIPVLTTRSGHRGYAWKDGALPIADSPRELAELTRTLQSNAQRDQARRLVQRVSASMPNAADVAQLVREALIGHSQASTPL